MSFTVEKHFLELKENLMDTMAAIVYLNQNLEDNQ
jgi:hypothetical protein